MAQCYMSVVIFGLFYRGKLSLHCRKSTFCCSTIFALLNQDTDNLSANNNKDLVDNRPLSSEFIIIGTRQQLAKINIEHITVGYNNRTPSTSVRNLGAWFDCTYYQVMLCCFLPSAQYKAYKEVFVTRRS